MRSLTVAAFLLTVIFGQTVHGQTVDGRWQGTYTCGQHALKPDFGPFTWKQLSFTVQNGAISGQHDYLTRSGIPTDAVFTGRVDPAGNIRIDVIAHMQNGGEDFHQTLTGRATSAGSIGLAGLMLNGKGQMTRDCRLALNLIAPPQPVTTTAQDADQERQHLEAQKQAALAREQKAVESQKAAEAARLKAATDQQAALEAQRAATAQANQDKDAAISAQQKADAERQAAEAALREADAMKQQAAIELQAAQAEKQAADDKLKAEQEQRKDIERLINLGHLPKSENPNDWKPWLSKFPIQEIQFCNVMDRYQDDLKHARDNRNEIKVNQIKKQNQEDLESLVPEGDFDSWVVHAVEVLQAQDGSAAIVLQAPCKALIGSYLGKKQSCDNPANFEGTIPEGSPLYREFAKMDNRDFVLVAGKLTAVKEPTPGPLPSYRHFDPGTYCTRHEAGDEDELFVVQLKSIFKLVPSSASN